MVAPNRDLNALAKFLQRPLRRYNASCKAINQQSTFTDEAVGPKHR